jgi:hypothetical protein
VRHFRRCLHPFFRSSNHDEWNSYIAVSFSHDS